jgi:hypothetical protein
MREILITFSSDLLNSSFVSKGFIIKSSVIEAFHLFATFEMSFLE